MPPSKSNCGAVVIGCSLHRHRFTHHQFYSLLVNDAATVTGAAVVNGDTVNIALLNIIITVTLVTDVPTFTGAVVNGDTVVRGGSVDTSNLHQG